MNRRIRFCISSFAWFLVASLSSTMKCSLSELKMSIRFNVACLMYCWKHCVTLNIIFFIVSSYPVHSYVSNCFYVTYDDIEQKQHQQNCFFSLWFLVFFFFIFILTENFFMCGSWQLRLWIAWKAYLVTCQAHSRFTATEKSAHTYTVFKK